MEAGRHVSTGLRVGADLCWAASKEPRPLPSEVLRRTLAEPRAKPDAPRATGDRADSRSTGATCNPDPCNGQSFRHPAEGRQQILPHRRALNHRGAEEDPGGTRCRARDDRRAKSARSRRRPGEPQPEPSGSRSTSVPRPRPEREAAESLSRRGRGNAAGLVRGAGPNVFRSPSDSAGPPHATIHGGGRRIGRGRPSRNRSRTSRSRRAGSLAATETPIGGTGA